MTKTAAVLIACVVAGFAFFPLHDWPVKKYASGVWPVETATRFCSATLVGRNGVFLTAAHCVGDDETITVPPLAKILARDAAKDVLVYQAPTVGTPLPLALKEPAPGDMVLALGYGNASENLTPIPTWWIGPAKVDDDAAGPAVVGGAIVGMSGGPLLNRRGEVVGLVRAVHTLEMQFVADVIPLAALRPAAKAWVR